MASIPNKREECEQVQTYMVDFLLLYKEPDDTEPYYVNRGREMVLEKTKTLYVSLYHVAHFDSDQVACIPSTLASYICARYMMLHPFLCTTVALFLKKIPSDGGCDVEEYASKSRFTMAFYDVDKVIGTRTIRSLQCDCIGQLTTIMGTVTRKTEKKPELHTATFECSLCQTEITNVVQQFKLTYPVRCPGNRCNNTSAFILKPECKTTQWADWQRLRLQELESEVPLGCMPRSFDVILRDELTDTANAGDKIKLTGCLVAVPDVPTMMKTSEIKHVARVEMNKAFKTNYVEGVQGIGGLGNKELCYKTMFFGCVVECDRAGATSRADSQGTRLAPFSPAEIDSLIAFSKSPKVLDRLAAMVAPNIHGNLDAKKGIVLQLLGGVIKKTSGDKNALRGAINICIVGDPSTGKSQFLKYVSSLMPRSIYTSGKCSTAAGLTASVTRDPEINDTVIEPGALMLADNGICCIDEFDKMDLTDQVAIHEAMEQQTITLSKQGIQATLSARCSILAATLPRGHVYDNSKTLAANVGLTPALMSRFDLFFILKDEPDDALDQSVVEHVMQLYSMDGSEEQTNDELSQEGFKRYIKYAKDIKPQFTDESHKLIVRAYTLLRAKSHAEGAGKMHVTVRQLESLIRLSEAVARAHLSNFVVPSMVDIALQLVQLSQFREGHEMEFEDTTEDPTMEPVHEGDGVDHPEERRQIRMNLSEYEKVTKMLAQHLHTKTMAGEDVSEEDLITKYLADMEAAGKIKGRAEMVAEGRKIKSIIDRLIGRDRIIVVKIRSDKPDEKFLLKHPNYVV